MLLQLSSMKSLINELKLPEVLRYMSCWRELLGLKKLYQSTNGKSKMHQMTSSNNTDDKSPKQFLHRSSKSSMFSFSEASLSRPLLKDSDSESISMVSCLSLSPFSSSHVYEDFLRLSLDLDVLANHASHACVTSKKQLAFNHPKLKGKKPLDPPERPKGHENGENVTKSLKTS